MAKDRSSFEQPANLAPSHDILRFTESIYQDARTSDRPEIQALAKWVAVCSHESVYHSKKAAHLRGVHFALAGMAIACSAAAAMLSLPGAIGSPGNALSVAAACCGAMSTCASSMVAMLNPQGRRNNHLRSESDYSVLGRDIAVFLATTGDDGAHDDHGWSYAMRNFQRRLDNVEALAPP